MAKTDKETAPAADTPTDYKRRALDTILAVLDPLDRPSRLDVLRAAASFHGIQLGTEIRP